MVNISKIHLHPNWRDQSKEDKGEVPSSLQVKYWKMYISQSESSKSKISKFAIWLALTLAGSKIRLRFLRYRQIYVFEVMWPFKRVKWRNNRKFVILYAVTLKGSKLLCVALSLTVSEITAILNIPFITSQSAIFNGRVNPITPEEASLKSIIIRYIWKSKFLLLTDDMENVY